MAPARSPAPPRGVTFPLPLSGDGCGSVTAALPAARAYVMLGPSPVAALTPLALSTWRAASGERGSPARPSPAYGRPMEGCERGAPVTDPAPQARLCAGGMQGCSDSEF